MSGSPSVPQPQPGVPGVSSLCSYTFDLRFYFLLTVIVFVQPSSIAVNTMQRIQLVLDKHPRRDPPAAPQQPPALRRLDAGESRSILETLRRLGPVGWKMAPADLVWSVIALIFDKCGEALNGRSMGLASAQVVESAQIVIANAPVGAAPDLTIRHFASQLHKCLQVEWERDEKVFALDGINWFLMPLYSILHNREELVIDRLRYTGVVHFSSLTHQSTTAGWQTVVQSVTGERPIPPMGTTPMIDLDSVLEIAIQHPLQRLMRNMVDSAIAADGTLAFKIQDINTCFRVCSEALVAAASGSGRMELSDQILRRFKELFPYLSGTLLPADLDEVDGIELAVDKLVKHIREIVFGHGFVFVDARFFDGFTQPAAGSSSDEDNDKRHFERVTTAIINEKTASTNFLYSLMGLFGQFPAVDAMRDTTQAARTARDARITALLDACAETSDAECPRQVLCTVEYLSAICIELARRVQQTRSRETEFARELVSATLRALLVSHMPATNIVWWLSLDEHLANIEAYGLVKTEFTDALWVLVEKHKSLAYYTVANPEIAAVIRDFTAKSHRAQERVREATDATYKEEVESVPSLLSAQSK
jgi:hypothetical protein